MNGIYAMVMDPNRNPLSTLRPATQISADGLSQQYVDSNFLRFNRQLDVLRRVDGGASVVCCWHLDHGSGFFPALPRPAL